MTRSDSFRDEHRNTNEISPVLIKDKASSGENMMQTVVEAVENKCTLEEIADTLREVYGEYK